MTIQRFIPVPGPQVPEDRIVAESRVNAGMITIIDETDLPNNAVTVAKNVRVLYDIMERRPALVDHTPTKPNSSKVLKIASFKKLNGDVQTLRFTSGSVYKRNSASWTLLTGTLTGTDNDRIQVASVKDIIVFTNNGADYIQTFDVGLTSYARLGNAFKYKYCASFYDRIIGAHRTDGGNLGVEVGWSGLGEYEKWDPIADDDLTAGTNPLLDDSSGLGDLITGCVAFSNIMCIPKERSIWIATKNASGQNPFNFQNRVPNQGCDVPYSIVNVLKGIAFLDLLTESVWAYAPGADSPERIGTNVEKDIIRSIENPDFVFGGFNYKRNQYSICIPSETSGVVKQWTYNFDTPSWVYDEYETISSLDEIKLQVGSFKVDDLIGKVDDLLGKVDDLGGEISFKNLRLYGHLNGDLDEETDVLSDDEGEIISKIYSLQTFDNTITKLFFKFQIPAAPCTIKLYFSKDGNDWTLAKTKTFGELSKRNNTSLLTYIRNLYCRQFQWRLTCNTGQFKLTEYSIKSSPAGESSV